VRVAACVASLECPICCRCACAFCDVYSSFFVFFARNSHGLYATLHTTVTQLSRFICNFTHNSPAQDAADVSLAWNNNRYKITIITSDSHLH
jgi:hypothetical protein